jgi:hypothetical protein
MAMNSDSGRIKLGLRQGGKPENRFFCNLNEIAEKPIFWIYCLYLRAVFELFLARLCVCKNGFLQPEQDCIRFGRFTPSAPSSTFQLTATCGLLCRRDGTSHTTKTLGSILNKNQDNLQKTLYILYNNGIPLLMEGSWKAMN